MYLGIILQTLAETEWLKWVVWFLGSGVLAGVIGFWLNKSESVRRDRLRIIEQLLLNCERPFSDEFKMSFKLAQLYFSKDKKISKTLREYEELEVDTQVGQGGVPWDGAADERRIFIGEMINEMSASVGHGSVFSDERFERIVR